MYYHKTCGGVPLVQRIIIIETGLIISKYGISVLGEGNIQETTAGELQIICSSCKERIAGAGQLEGYCMECGNKFGIDELYQINGIGGHYCRACCEEIYKGNQRRIVGTLFNNALTTKE